MDERQKKIFSEHMAGRGGTKTKKESIARIIPEIERYKVEKVGGAVKLRHVRDTLQKLGLRGKKKNVPYKVQKERAEAAKRTEEARRSELLEMGVYKKKRGNGKEAIKKKRRY